MTQYDEFSARPEYKEMINNFDSFYQEELLTIIKELDNKHLQYEPSSHADENKQEPKAHDSELAQSLSFEWQNINKTTENKENDEDNLECKSIDNCPMCCRIVLILDLFDKLVLKYLIDPKSEKQSAEFTDIFMYTLSEKHNYFVHDLLNDFQHLNMYHLNYKHIQQLQTCTINNKIDYCVHDLIIQFRDHRMKSLKKYQQHNKYKLFMEYLQRMDHRQMTLLNIVSKIHFVINHQMIISDDKEEKNLDDEVPNRRIIRSRTAGMNRDDEDDAKYNKFVNEITIDGDNEPAKSVDNCSTDLLWNNLIESGVEEKEASAIMEYVMDNKYDTDALAEDIIDCDGNDPYLKYPQCNIMNQLPQDQNRYYLMRVIKNTLNIEGNDNDKVPPFQFGGGIFKYTKYYAKKERYIKAPKYGSLKEELLNNTIYEMDSNDWDELLQKVSAYHSTKYIRGITVRDLGAANRKCEIPIGLPLTKSHLLVLMSYTNNTKMQYHFKKYGCKKLYQKQPLNELIKSHLEISNWYRLLFETIYFYGTVCNQNNTFYTGMSIRLSFSTFVPIFASPISTSSEFCVAHKFSKGAGIVLTLKPLPSSIDRYFNVELLSDYPDEKECLFFTIKRLEITNINYFKGKNVYGSMKWLKVFKLISGTFYGHYVFMGSNVKGMKKVQNNLSSLLNVYKLYNNVDIKDDSEIINHENIEIGIYIQQMFYILLQNIKHIDVIKSQYELLNENIRRQLICIGEKDGNHAIKLGPILQSLSIKPKHITIWEEYHWVLSDAELRKLKQGKADQYIKCNEKWNYKSSSMTVKFSVDLCRKGNGTKHTAISIEMHDISKASISGRFSALVDELGYVKNAVKFSIARKGGATGTYFFDDHLIDSVTSLSIHLSVCFW